jgi:hypothetical protein
MKLQENINRIKEVMGLINEQNAMLNVSDDHKKQMDTIINPIMEKTKQYYIDHYNKPETIAKFKNQNNANIIKQFIPTLNHRLYVSNTTEFGGVDSNYPGTIFLNSYLLFTKQGEIIKQKDGTLADTIVHEMAHCIEDKLKALGENTIVSTYFYAANETEEYILSDSESYARIQRLRNILGLTPNADAVEIRDKMLEFINAGKMTFPNTKVINSNKKNAIAFAPTKEVLIGTKERNPNYYKLYEFFSKMRINNTEVHDIALLLAKCSSVSYNNDYVYINFERLAYYAKSVVNAPKKSNTITQPT